jgi:hypothetical protein
MTSIVARGVYVSLDKNENFRKWGRRSGKAGKDLDLKMADTNAVVKKIFLERISFVNIGLVY